LVDEAQDLEPLQRRLIERIVNGGARLVAVGDCRQSIFSWRGADRDAMEKLRASAGAVRLTLPVSYRLPKNIIAATLAYTGWNILPAPDAIDGEIHAFQPLNLATLPAGALILCRRRAPLARQAALALRRGRKVRMIGAADGRALAAVLRDAGKGDTALHVAVTAVVRDLGQRARLHKTTGHKEAAAAAQDRADTIAALSGALMARNRAATVADMVAMLGEMYVDELSGDCLNFSTIHRAKGAESQYVVIIGLDKIDGDQANELRYVALTRSQHTLHIADVAMESEEKRERRTSAGASAPPRIETPYEVLGLRYGASKEEIKRAFQKLVMETHPDRNLPTSDAGRFAAVVRARDALLGG
jgi:superfamily I DNA/RNA helicase